MFAKIIHTCTALISLQTWLGSWTNLTLKLGDSHGLVLLCKCLCLPPRYLYSLSTRVHISMSTVNVNMYVNM